MTTQSANGEKQLGHFQQTKIQHQSGRLDLRMFDPSARFAPCIFY
jgi:hypothetical protein